MTTTNNRTDYFTPCTCARGNKQTLHLVHAWDGTTTTHSDVSVHQDVTVAEVVKLTAQGEQSRGDMDDVCGYRVKYCSWFMC